MVQPAALLVCASCYKGQSWGMATVNSYSMVPSPDVHTTMAMVPWRIPPMVPLHDLRTTMVIVTMEGGHGCLPPVVPSPDNCTTIVTAPWEASALSSYSTIAYEGDSSFSG